MRSQDCEGTNGKNRSVRVEEIMSSGLGGPNRGAKLPELLTPEEVAAITGMSVETLAQWRSQKRGIPYLKIGRAVRYDPVDVQTYLEGCRVSVSDPQERRQRP